MVGVVVFVAVVLNEGCGVGSHCDRLSFYDIYVWCLSWDSCNFSGSKYCVSVSFAGKSCIESCYVCGNC